MSIGNKIRNFYYPNELTLNKINIISFIDDFRALLVDILSNNKYDVIGIDCEWKPVFKKGEQSRLSIVQIATRDIVYIIDILKIEYEITPQDMILFNDLFNSSTPRKLGFGFRNDARMLRMCFNNLNTNISKKVINIDDLALKVIY
jgi:hypothetical protein